MTGPVREKYVFVAQTIAVMMCSLKMKYFLAMMNPREKQYHILESNDYNCIETNIKTQNKEYYGWSEEPYNLAEENCVFLWPVSFLFNIGDSDSNGRVLCAESLCITFVNCILGE